MATLTLARPVVSKRIKSRRDALPVSKLVSKLGPAKPARPSNAPNTARLQEVEDQLLASAMANHPNFDDAIERLLSDIEALPDSAAPRRASQLRRHTQVERMEDLLLQAVMGSHPNREIAIERLLGDVVGDAAIDEHDEQHDRAEFDKTIDNDFDGLS